MTQLDTRSVHAGRDDLTALGVHVPPIDLSTTYPLPDVGTGGTSYDELTQGHGPDGGSLVYQRLWNPTVARFEGALAELEHTDGSGNQEHSPDVRMAWPGADPLAYFRTLVDDVDEQLADLLARRAALTRAIQPLKATSERDPAREQEIAATMATRAPALGQQRLARILHSIISESLDAAGHDDATRDPHRD